MGDLGLVLVVDDDEDSRAVVAEYWHSAATA